MRHQATDWNTDRCVKCGATGLEIIEADLPCDALGVEMWRASIRFRFIERKCCKILDHFKEVMALRECFDRA